MKWLKAHKLIVLAAVIGLAVVWYFVRRSKGLAAFEGGHATPEDAIAYGWVVHQMGISGWMEISPTGETYEHFSGWTGDPYAKG
jgi:hypothetical protein